MLGVMDGDKVEPGSGRRRFEWLPKGVVPWDVVAVGGPEPVPRAVVAVVLIAVVAVVWEPPIRRALLAVAVVLVLALLAWPLRRRAERVAVEGSWLAFEAASVSLVRGEVDWPPPEPPGPGARVDIAEARGRILDHPRSAAAVRAALALLRATWPDAELPGRDIAGIGLPLVGAEEDFEEDAPRPRPGAPCVVVHDDRGGFALGTDVSDGLDEEANAKRARARQTLLARLAARTGSAVPSAHPGVVVPEEVMVTAGDVRAFVAAGLGPAYRLEAAFTGMAVEEAVDLELDLRRLRGWPSQVDSMDATARRRAGSAGLAGLLRDDLAAQAERDTGWESAHAVAEPLVPLWRARWEARLATLATRPTSQILDTAPATPVDREPGLSPTGRAALLLAVTATDLTDHPLRSTAAALGVPTHASARWLAWPRRQKAARVADGLLLWATLAVPVVLAIIQATR
jgi:hypothetical protein